MLVQKNPGNSVFYSGVIVFLIFALWAFCLVLNEGHWVQRVAQNLGETEGAWWYLLLRGAVLALVLWVNYLLLIRLPRRLQIYMVWLELSLLVILFFSAFDLSLVFIKSKIWFLLSQGMVMTLFISAVSIAIAFVLAMVGALAKLSSNGVAVGIATFYTSIFRGLPLLMQLFLLYMGLPQLGFVIDPIPAGVVALSLCYGAYMTEIFRAGIESIPKGQWEAARALGLYRGKTLRLIILPQALKIIIPPTGNNFISMLKDSSLVSVIGVWELTYIARTAGQRDFRHIEMLITAALVYWGLSIVLEVVQARIEARYKK